MQLSLSVVQFRLLLARPLQVPPDKYGNVIRGAFGLALPAGLIPPPATVPSGFRSPPAPYLFRVEPIAGGLLLSVHLLADSSILLPAFHSAASRVAAAGLGPGRVPVTIAESHTSLVQLPLAPITDAPSNIRVHFLTPTHLKHAGAPSSASFPALFHRLRDRILYFAAPAQDHSALARELASRAAAIRQIDAQLTRVATQRTSTRTGQTHSIGGFVGQAAYSGNFQALWPWLLAAEWTGVGRHTTWGNGHIRCEPLGP